ncbi:MAG: hypothetical protein KJN90_11340 [Gammaproteobacteria bacterium]|nr:hypothetical protein [Gammaproteobacteria bacterium]
MDLQAYEEHDHHEHKDRRIWFGLAATFIWVLLGIVYISGNVGWSSFVSLPIDEMGTFLEGAFAPLAFLWLVIGLFIQQTVLAENNRELRRTNLQSEKQTQAIAATELNARQETFFKIAENTRKQLGAISGLLFISSQGPVGDENFTQEELNEFWQQYASGDYEVFSRRFLTMSGDPGVSMEDLLYGTEIRERHSNNFIVGYDRLLKLAAECDSDHIIQDALVYSAHGLLNIRMRELHPTVKFDEIQTTDSAVYLEQMVKVDAEKNALEEINRTSS